MPKTSLRRRLKRSNAKLFIHFPLNTTPLVRHRDKPPLLHFNTNPTIFETTFPIFLYSWVNTTPAFDHPPTAPWTMWAGWTLRKRR